MPDELNIAAIEAAARAATPGPWFAVDVTEDGLTVVDDGRQSGMFSIKAETYEANHIANLDPQTTLRMVAALRNMMILRDEFLPDPDDSHAQIPNWARGLIRDYRDALAGIVDKPEAEEASRG